jgi:hypothetical protein
MCFMPFASALILRINSTAEFELVFNVDLWFKKCESKTSKFSRQFLHYKITFTFSAMFNIFAFNVCKATIVCFFDNHCTNPLATNKATLDVECHPRCVSAKDASAFSKTKQLLFRFKIIPYSKVPLMYLKICFIVPQCFQDSFNWCCARKLMINVISSSVYLANHKSDPMAALNFISEQALSIALLKGKMI